MGMPIYFSEPNYLCKNGKNNVFQPCLKKEACHSQNYIIDKQHSLNSLTIDFKLFCEKSDYIILLKAFFFLGNL